MNFSDVDIKVRKHLAKGLFAPRAKQTPEAIFHDLNDLPRGMTPANSQVWTERISLVRRLVCFGPQSQRALRIMQVIASPAFARVFEANTRIKFPAVRRELRSAQFRMEAAEIDILRRAFFRDATLTSAQADELLETLCLHPADREVILESVVFVAPQDGEMNHGPQTRAEKRVWKSFEEAERLISDVKSIADVIKPGFSTQDEGRIDGKPINEEMLSEAKRAMGGRYKTGSPQAESATALLESLQRVEDPADTVTRHTRGLLQDSAEPHALRAGLKIGPQAYAIIATKPSKVLDAVPMSINGTNALDLGGSSTSAGGTTQATKDRARILGNNSSQKRFTGVFIGVVGTMGFFGILSALSGYNTMIELFLVIVFGSLMVALYQWCREAWQFALITIGGSFIIAGLGFGIAWYPLFGGVIGGIMLAFSKGGKGTSIPDLGFTADEAEQVIDRR